MKFTLIKRYRDSKKMQLPVSFSMSTRPAMNIEDSKSFQYLKQFNGFSISIMKTNQFTYLLEIQAHHLNYYSNNRLLFPYKPFERYMVQKETSLESHLLCTPAFCNALKIKKLSTTTAIFIN